MDETAKLAIVDTYAIMADLTGQATERATRMLDSIRVRRMKGILHYLIVYELAYHWRRGRLPFRDERELLEFVETYFSIVDLDAEMAVKASQAKMIGDQILKSSDREELRRRKLSTCDATSIMLAARLKAPIVTGDADLTYVAQKMGIQVIW